MTDYSELIETLNLLLTLILCLIYAIFKLQNFKHKKLIDNLVEQSISRSQSYSQSYSLTDENQQNYKQGND